MKRLIVIATGIVAAAMAPCLAGAEFRVEGAGFVLDGQPFQIRSGEIHYPRVPREEWRSRIRMARAMGLNTVSTYVFWNLHETQRGNFDFGGEKDVAAFIRLCGEEGMRVIVRPGPYVCAEWDLGGLPAWLLAERGIKLRSTDPRFLDPAKTWMKRMGEMIQPLTVQAGGAVLMVQLENEYGNFGSDKEYLKELEKALRSGGYQGIVFTSDGASEAVLRRGSRPGSLMAVNFGGGAKSAFDKLQKASPGQPSFTAEFWVGWFDHWQRPHHQVDARGKSKDLEAMMRMGASFNLYMFHGGSTRGLWTGANWEDRYRPTTCGYDYSAPLDESGRPSASFHLFREVILSGLERGRVPDVPEMSATGDMGKIRLTEQLDLLDSLPAGDPHEGVRTMEELGQSTGFVVYRARVEGPISGDLVLGKVKDRVHVLMDGKIVGVSGRSTRVESLRVDVPPGSHRLDFMVENMGRINYGVFMEEERKGLAEPVVLAGRSLGPFEHISLPMQQPPAGSYEEIGEDGARGGVRVLRGKFKATGPRDTWLDMRGFGRGIVWVNGHNLGRYWKAGPQQSIFLPGCWLNSKDENEIVVLELEAPGCPSEVPTSKTAIWGLGPE